MNITLNSEEYAGKYIITMCTLWILNLNFHIESLYLKMKKNSYPILTILTFVRR